MKGFRFGIAGALVLAAMVAPATSRAQAPATDAVHLNQYRPAPSVDDGFAISRPDDRGHLLFGARLDLDYALNPLVVEGVAGDASTEQGALVEHQLAAHLNFSLGLFERLVVFLGLPINLVQSGQSVFGLPAGDGAGLGDMFIGVRGRIYGEPDDIFAIGAQLLVTFPTAGAANASQRYSGETGATISPVLLFELRPVDMLRVTGNLGARFRSASESSQVVNLSVGHELTWGIGLTVEAVEDLLDLYLEVFGSAGFDSIGTPASREATPFEGLLGVRVEPITGLEIGVGLGTGLSRGYGTPDFRGVLTVGYAQRPIRDTVGDRDGDGLLDNVDRCPDEPEDFDGFEDVEGCPDPDNDRDGILDVSDQCPMEPEDRDNFQDEDGCPDPDNDQDGVLDVNDRCPNVPGPPENQGCPVEAEVQVEQGVIRTLERIEFETDSDVILASSVHIVENVRDVLRDHGDITLVRIEGHTDDRADDDHNMDLSRRRARSVVLWLVGHGIRPERLEAYGCGELHPVQTNATEDGRQANRRVEFHIMQPRDPRSVPRVQGCRAIPHNQ